MCNFLEYNLPTSASISASMATVQIVYKRYASLYFVAAVESDSQQDYFLHENHQKNNSSLLQVGSSVNELIILEAIHRLVECLDRYFGNVCELDLIFNYQKAYHIFDELFEGGELCESSKKAVLKYVAGADSTEIEERDAANANASTLNTLLNFKNNL